MTINPIKTEIMSISKSPLIGPIPPIILDNHLMNYTTQSSSLGVTLDNKLCWAPNINSITANFNEKILKEVFYISKNKPDLNKQLYHFNTFLTL